MYTTISLAAYRQAMAPAANNENGKQEGRVTFPAPPDPHSGYLVFQRYEAEEGSWPDDRLGKLPIPQDKCFTITEDENHIHRPYFIPVLGQPISSNCYYVVRANGESKGWLESCSKGERVTTFCFCTCVEERMTPRPLDLNNPYQKFQIIQMGRHFSSKSITADGVPPEFLHSHWSAAANKLRGKNVPRLPHVQGENASSRAQLPPFDFSLSETETETESRSAIIVSVGEWYSPFIFIKEQGNRFKDPDVQLMETPFYKMDLEKFWEEIYSTEVSSGEQDKDIFMQRTIRVEEALLLGSEAVKETLVEDGSVWMEGLRTAVRLSWPVIAKMRADQGRKGSDGIGRDVKVEKLFNNIGIGRKFVCYVVVERYVLKRMDGSIVLTYSFRHWNQVKGKCG